MNDVSSLSLKQRRKQTLQLQHQQQQQHEQSASVSDGSDLDHDVLSRALTAPANLPAAAAAGTAEAAPEPIATIDERGIDSPKRRNSLNGPRMASPDLTRDGSKIAKQIFPSHDVVQEALQERWPASLSPVTNKRIMRRKESVIMRKFRSAFPSSKHRREQLVRSESSAGDLMNVMDGGFAEHAKEVSDEADEDSIFVFALAILTCVHVCQFKQQPLFERSTGHRVETYPHSPGWSFSTDTLAAPSLFQRPFELYCNGAAVRPRLWVWKGGLCVIVAVPVEEDGVRVVVHSGSGSQSVLVQLANVDVLSKVELLRQLLALANPLIPAGECVRVRGDATTRLKANLLLFEKRFTPQSIDVAVVKYLRPDAITDSPLAGYDGKVCD